ncbi:MAG: DNA polymerase ligase N-terminal domain-containing protein [Balneolaceae bacterium]|nr:DNA polymerase ligase N-terminal domain-containing protein [Balneolaceae bacterium]
MSSDKTYKKKRDLEASPEPKSSGKKSSSGGDPIFVIQKHDASNLHYDFRLEIDGTLKSWAVPKGPSTDPSEKRLAVPVEDHPIEYADFEGVIPEDQYGAGTVMIWDKGTFKNLKEKDGEKVPLNECYENGRLEISLDGKKISGGYALIKAKNMDGNWLLVKMDDEKADARRNPVNTEKKSAKTGRTLQEIKREETEDA